MLYDNALLAQVYLEAHLVTGDEVFAAVARRTLDYVLGELADPRGGFWSSQDAQSEGVEGKFFVWSVAEFDRVLGERSELAKRHFGVTEPANWELGNVLAQTVDAATLATARGMSVEAVRDEIQRVRAQLRTARQQRIAPSTDDKVLVAWNGMMLRALATGFRTLGDERYRAAARRCADFLLRELVVDGRLRRAWHGGTARHTGCLEDHGAFADGLLALFEIDGDPRWLAAARDLLRTTVAHFGAADGGFHATADDAEALVARSTSATDGATASGTALVTGALLRVGLLLGDEPLYERGVAALRAQHELLAKSPAAVPALLAALQFHTAEPREIVVAGAANDPRTQALLRAAWRQFPAPRVVAWVHDGNRDALVALSPAFADKRPIDGVPAAYVCRRGVCELPIVDPARLGGGK